jgi:NhaA family Na+:H+ antiporter
MPLFAFANAGVPVTTLRYGAETAASLTWAIIIALVIGKPLGITAFTWATTRSGLGAVSEELRWRGIGLVGSLGGIGFTMSLFITNLAFSDPALVVAARFAVLLGSAIAAVVGFLFGRFALARAPHGRSR